MSFILNSKNTSKARPLVFFSLSFFLPPLLLLFLLHRFRRLSPPTATVRRVGFFFLSSFLSLFLSFFLFCLSFFLSFFLQKGITIKKGFIFIIYYLFILFNTRLCSQKVDLGLSICYGLLQNLGLSICYVYLTQDSVLMIIECM